MYEMVLTNAVHSYVFLSDTPGEAFDWEMPYEQILREGLGILSDTKLVQLAIFPEAMSVLAELISQEFLSPVTGNVWREQSIRVAMAAPSTRK